ncbi:hypothetical protein EON79_01890 [bacterium]|nr:MAG: hypothetical protein EON79_01890 [bacterium]
MKFGFDAYVPRVERDTSVPPVPDGFYLGGFSPLAQSELGVWRRLMASRAAPYSLLLFGPGWDAVLPASLLALRFEGASEPLWLGRIAPDRPERSFCVVVREGVAKILVIGPPTEDVWEEVEKAIGR